MRIQIIAHQDLSKMFISSFDEETALKRHLEELRQSLDLYSAYYENIILLGYFNVNIDDPCTESFCNLYRFRSLIKDPTCLKIQKIFRALI